MRFTPSIFGKLLEPIRRYSPDAVSTTAILRSFSRGPRKGGQLFCHILRAARGTPCYVEAL
jgi:hypothetical protein